MFFVCFCRPILPSTVWLLLSQIASLIYCPCLKLAILISCHNQLPKSKVSNNRDMPNSLNKLWQHCVHFTIHLLLFQAFFFCFDTAVLEWYLPVVLYCSALYRDLSFVTLVLFFSFNWTKDGKPFNLLSDPRIITFNNSGTFVIQNHGIITNFQGKYRCYASNALGTAMSEEIELIVPSKGFCFTFIMLFKIKNYGKD